MVGVTARGVEGALVQQLNTNLDLPSSNIAQAMTWCGDTPRLVRRAPSGSEGRGARGLQTELGGAQRESGG
jgi:hypothetical protein